MKTTDFHQFEKQITQLGYYIAATSKHHEVLDKNGQSIAKFAIHHSKGSKRVVLGVYVKQVIASIHADLKTTQEETE